MAARLLHISALYLVLGACLGMVMGVTQNFSLVPVHAHVLLAGWLTLAVAGVVYRLFPAAAGTRLAKAHFWLHNLGLPVFMAGLALMLTGQGKLDALIAGGASALLLGLLAFAVNVWRQVRQAG